MHLGGEKRGGEGGEVASRCGREREELGDAERD